MENGTTRSVPAGDGWNRLFKLFFREALDAADAAYKQGGVIDVSVMEELLSEMLAVQLVDVHKDATSGTLSHDSQ
jgi:hypothetical protein